MERNPSYFLFLRLLAQGRASLNSCCMNERMSKYRHALGLLTGSTHYATAAVKYCTPTEKWVFIGASNFHLPEIMEMFPKTMEMCMHVSLRGVGDTGVLSHHCSPQTIRYQIPTESDLWLLERPFFTVSGHSLITKQFIIMQLPQLSTIHW